MTGRIALKLQRGSGFSLDVDCEIAPQGVTVLFGPSGCGKTTILRCMAGLDRARGYVKITQTCWQDDEAGIYVPTHRRNLGYVFQEASLFDHLSVRDNLAFGLKRRSIPDGDRRLQEAVELLGIGHLLDRRPLNLSGGERQRCAIARSLVYAPDVLLLDEPLAALDDNRRRDILPWLERLRDELAIPMVYVTHSKSELMRLADHLILMRDGRAVAHGAIDAILADPTWSTEFANEPSVLLRGNVLEQQAQWGLTRVGLGGSGLSLWLPAADEPIGSAIRASVKAADVSISLDESTRSSIQNRLPARIVGLHPYAGRAHVLVSMDVAGQTLQALVTSRSVHELGLFVSQTVWAQIKALSVR
jgi:molybdate transport system ATP-binding protein